MYSKTFDIKNYSFHWVHKKQILELENNRNKTRINRITIPGNRCGSTLPGVAGLYHPAFVKAFAVTMI